MKISIITLFPDMIRGFFEESIVKRAIEKQQVEIEFINLRTFAADKYGTVDDRPYGGGAGMVLKVDVIDRALSSVMQNNQGIIKKISTSPRGILFTQAKAKEYATLSHLIIFAGHYEGMDERAVELFDEEISLGDFVMTGGEIPAAAIVDSIVRLLLGVLKKDNATEIESFWNVSIDELIQVVGNDDLLQDLKNKGKQQVKLLEFPHYTRPESYNGKQVPELLTNGNHAEIEKWRMKQSYEVTKKNRPDLLT